MPEASGNGVEGEAGEAADIFAAVELAGSLDSFGETSEGEDLGARLFCPAPRRCREVE